MGMMYCFALLLGFLNVALAATSADWRGRSIYQVVVDRFSRTDNSTVVKCDCSKAQYCGGSWQGLINKLDYIKDMGFTAVWISPIVHNIEVSSPGSAYHGYWQDDIFALNEHFGSHDDLMSLSDALHARDMYLMVDVVTNHFAATGRPETVDYSKFRPFNESQYFHAPCPINDYGNQVEVENCWLGFDTPVELADLDTTRQDVRDIFNSWISDLVFTYAIDGLRIDTVKHVQKDFWTSFNQAAGVYCLGEVFDGNADYTCDYQHYMDGLLNYPLYYAVRRAFQHPWADMQILTDQVNWVKDVCKDSTLLAPFLENHDNPRFPHETDSKDLIYNAIAFTLLADGIPIIYQGQEQLLSGGNDPYDREAIWLTGFDTGSPLYIFIRTINALRNHAINLDGDDYLTYKAWPIYSDATTIVMRKGYDGNAVVSVFTNQADYAGRYTLNIWNTGFAEGQEVMDILSCSTIHVGGWGLLRVPMFGGKPRIYYLKDKLSGSALCKHTLLIGDEQTEHVLDRQDEIFLATPQLLKVDECTSINQYTRSRHIST